MAGQLLGGVELRIVAHAAVHAQLVVAEVLRQRLSDDQRRDALGGGVQVGHALQRREIAAAALLVQHSLLSLWIFQLTQVVFSLRQQGIFYFIVAGFSPAGRKASNRKKVATALPKAKTAFCAKEAFS